MDNHIYNEVLIWKNNKTLTHDMLFDIITQLYQYISHGHDIYYTFHDCNFDTYLLSMFVENSMYFPFTFTGEKNHICPNFTFLAYSIKIYICYNYWNMIHLAAKFRTSEIQAITNRKKYISTKSRHQNVQK